jgi:sugar phosphate isomerase/epimerase
VKLGATSFINTHLAVEEFLTILVEQDLRYVELKCDWHACDPEVLDLNRIKEWQELLQSYQLYPSLHACYIDLNLASLSENIRKASVKRVTQCIQLASNLGASYVTIHPGKFSRDHPPFLFPKAQERAADSIRELISICDEQNVLLALENTQNGSDWGLLINPKTIKTCLERLESQMAKVVVDFGHVHTHGLDPLDFLYSLKPFICAVHIHNNDGRTDLHQPLGEGSLDYPSVLKKLAAIPVHFPILIEMHNLEDLLTSRDYLRKSGI